MGLGKRCASSINDSWFGILLWRNGQNQERSKYDDDVIYNYRNRKYLMGFLRI